MSDSISRRFDKTAQDITPEELAKAHELIEEEEKRLQSSGEIEELKKTGEIAHNFMAGMDKVQKVLLILSLKFGRASTMLVGVLIGLGVFLTMMVWSLVALYNTKHDMGGLVENIRKLQDQQQVIISKTEDSYQRAKMAEQRAKEAVEACPKIVVNEETGQTSLQVKGDPVEMEKAAIKTAEKPRRATRMSRRTSPKPSPKSSKGVYEIPLDLR